MSKTVYTGCKFDVVTYKLEGKRKLGAWRSWIFFKLLGFVAWLGICDIGMDISMKYDQFIDLPDDFDIEKYYPNCPFEVYAIREKSLDDESLSIL